MFEPGYRNTIVPQRGSGNGSQDGARARPPVDNYSKRPVIIHAIVTITLERIQTPNTTKSMFSVNLWLLRGASGWSGRPIRLTVFVITNKSNYSAYQRRLVSYAGAMIGASFMAQHKS